MASPQFPGGADLVRSLRRLFQDNLHLRVVKPPSETRRPGMSTSGGVTPREARAERVLLTPCARWRERRAAGREDSVAVPRRGRVHARGTVTGREEHVHGRPLPTSSQRASRRPEVHAAPIATASLSPCSPASRAWPLRVLQLHGVSLNCPCPTTHPHLLGRLSKGRLVNTL